MSDILGTGELADISDLFTLISRLALDLGVTSIVVLLVYYRLYRNRDFVFTYFIFNVITFSICMLLSKVSMELGFALGLFAVFGILRYRTEEIRLRDLTYMFIVIGVGIINSVANERVALAELLAVNAVIAGITAVLEFHPALRRYSGTSMLYDNLELLQDGRTDELYRDLHQRLGLQATRVRVHRIDLLRDAAEVTVFHTARGDAPRRTPARDKGASTAAESPRRHTIGDLGSPRL